MDLKDLKDLINLMNEHDLVEIEVEKEGMKIRLKKGGASDAVPVIINDKVSRAKGCDYNPSGSPEQTETKSKASQIKSPMIGTFYRASHPDAPVFVSVGDVIDCGQVICIIEAMKLMNEIKSEIKGKVTQILVNNGDPVEFGQPLFLIEPV